MINETTGEKERNISLNSKDTIGKKKGNFIQQAYRGKLENPTEVIEQKLKSQSLRSRN